MKGMPDSNGGKRSIPEKAELVDDILFGLVVVWWRLSSRTPNSPEYNDQDRREVGYQSEL